VKSGELISVEDDLTPLNLDALKSEELKQFNDELIKILEDYCSKEESLKQLQNGFSENEAVERWQNTGNDVDNNSVQDSRFQLGY